MFSDKIPNQSIFFLIKFQMNKISMKFLNNFIFNTPLYIALQNENIDIIQLLISHPDTDVYFRNLVFFI